MRTFWGVLIFDFQAVDTLSTACAGQLPLPGLFLIVPRPRAADSRPYGETCIPRRRGAYYAPAMSDPVPCPTGEDKPRPCDVVPSAAKNPAPAARSVEHCSAFSLRRSMVGATERRSPFTVGARITRPPCRTLYHVLRARTSLAPAMSFRAQRRIPPRRPVAPSTARRFPFADQWSALRRDVHRSP